MSQCSECGKPSKISIAQKNKQYVHYCMKCYNKNMAKQIDFQLSDIVPEHLDVEDCNGTPHHFEIEYMLFPHGQFLRALEEEKGKGKTRYRCAVRGDLDESFVPLWYRLTDRLEKMMSVKYTENGRWVKDKLEGYVAYNAEHDRPLVVVDGMPYTWEALSENISTYEGFRIKIEIVDATDDFEGE